MLYAPLYFRGISSSAILCPDSKVNIVGAKKWFSVVNTP
jgi:hypothetical protein